MSRRLASLLASLLLAIVAASAAIAQPSTPSVHPGTRLNFAATVGPAQFVRASSYPVGRSTVYVYQYLAGRMHLSVDVYDGGRRVPAGSDNPTVISQFNEEVTAIERSLKSQGVTNFERPAVPSLCTYGATSFRCIVMSGHIQGGGRGFSKLLLTGFRDHFVKVRADWQHSDGLTVSNADQALQGFVTALMR